MDVTKTYKFLLRASLVFCFISTSEQAGYSSSNIKSESSPAVIRKCGAVGNKKPWCACRSSISGTTIDLSSLGKNLEASFPPPKFRARSKEPQSYWYIAWTPCENFDMFTNMTLNPDAGEKACKGVGFARYIDTPAKICNGYGSHETSATFHSFVHDDATSAGNETEKFYIEFKYSEADGQERRAKILLECTPNSEKSSLEYDGDKIGVEDARFSSKYCCPKKSNPGPNKNNKLGTELISGISVAVVAAVIILIIYKRRHPIHHPVQAVAQEHDERHPLLL